MLGRRSSPKGTRSLFAGTTSPMICPVEWANRRTTRKNQKEDKTRRGQKQRQLKKLHQQSYVQLVGQGRHTRGQNTKNKPKLKHRVTQLTQIGRVRGVARRSRLLPALVIWPLTAHLFRDGASFLLLIETPPTFGRSLRFSICYMETLCLSYLLSVSPSVATIYLVGSFSRYHLVYQTSPMSHSSIFLISSTSRSSLRISHSPTMWCVVCGGAYSYVTRLSCLLYTSPSPRDKRQSRMPSSA